MTTTINRIKLDIAKSLVGQAKKSQEKARGIANFNKPSAFVKQLRKHDNEPPQEAFDACSKHLAWIISDIKKHGIDINTVRIEIAGKQKDGKSFKVLSDL